jgi:hypothetical protein
MMDRRLGLGLSSIAIRNLKACSCHGWWVRGQTYTSWILDTRFIASPKEVGPRWCLADLQRAPHTRQIIPGFSNGLVKNESYPRVGMT